MEKFRKLKVWHKAHKLVLEIYKITDTFPNSERFGLISQMRRAAISIVANIVEGTKRSTFKDKFHFCVISETSLEELKYYIILSYELGYINENTGKNLMEKSREVGKMLNGLKKFLNAN